MLMTYHRGKKGAKKYIKKHGFKSKYVDAILKQKYLYEKS